MLYKYLSLSSLSYKSIICEQQVYFASVLSMNDPFEGLPSYKVPSRQEVKRHLIAKGAKRKNVNKLLPLAMEDIQHNFVNARSLDEAHAAETGLLCMTPHRDNLLMWSHYADSHQGVCIGFDIKRPFDEEFGIGYDVEYSNKYPEICLLQRDWLMTEAKVGRTLLDKQAREDLMTKHYFTKSTEWAYEDEVRFMRPALGAGVGLMPFPSSQIKEVIIGCRVPEEKKAEIIRLVSEHCPHSKIIQSSISKYTYGLDFEVISPEC
ncbi:DUF2971 domain-containing protein [Vibrio sp. T11.5]|uniref:DUF2971 domain-containing protein n=1 Tax=Vibrio sp. T11.5 TaxID=2998836 RepID=UPI0022CD8E9D|nr:DUF2971 domain-containing protein [Vibrio sp. T11.5]MDA0118050.1 DUF2971 domain-containing protein [Vibrio sp. T11.5]